LKALISRFSRGALLSLGLLLVTPAIGAPAALKSGPQLGDRPLPFTSNLVTGPFRGQQHCYVCDLKDEPAVLVFARHPDEATARLLRDVRDAVKTHEKSKLFGWLVFLSGSDTRSEHDFERQAYEFVRKNGATTLPVSVLGDPAGPPGYLIAPDAEVTVIVFRKGKVLYNRAYGSREWGSRSAGAALRELPKLIETNG
jgi:hypothetical protein